MFKCNLVYFLVHKRLSMAEAVRRRPLTVEAGIRCWVSPHEICSEKSGTETGLPSSTLLVPYQYFFFQWLDSPLGA
jgi:hypothetical protein